MPINTPLSPEARRHDATPMSPQGRARRAVTTRGARGGFPGCWKGPPSRLPKSECLSAGRNSRAAKAASDHAHPPLKSDAWHGVDGQQTPSTWRRRCGPVECGVQRFLPRAYGCALWLSRRGRHRQPDHILLGLINSTTTVFSKVPESVIRHPAAVSLDPAGRCALSTRPRAMNRTAPREVVVKRCV
jgi:hypothetical protein